MKPTLKALSTWATMGTKSNEKELGKQGRALSPALFVPAAVQPATGTAIIAA
jgi:hypothetical protein